MPEVPRVLHVEDNDFFAKVTANVLESDYGIDVCRVGCAEDGLERLESRQFDCIVSDYEMPGMNGLEFLDAVRETYPDIPFVLLTGGGSEQIASKAISAGVTDYLQKTDGKEQFAVLANRIKNAIDRSRAERLANRQMAVNDLIWDASQAVMRATSREDIERTVCERLAGTEPYLVTWVGALDGADDTVRPQTAVGIDERYLEPISLDGPQTDAERGVVREAIETRSVWVERSPTLKHESAVQAADGQHKQFSIAGVPLVYEKQIYGVLAVWSGGRDAFSETERRVLSKFGTNVAYAIDSVQTRKELVRREQRLQVFNRILRHNLRNDLNVVHGYAENIGEEYPPARREAESIKRKVNELIEISEKAREVGKTLDADHRTNGQIDITDCVERTCAEFRQSYADATVLADTPDAAIAYADKTIEAAISELIENAIEHNDCEEPTVTVSVSVSDSDEDWVEVTILDNGPGIPEDERKVLAQGEETALQHGSGLGLWLTRWIVGKFGGELAFGGYHADGGAVTIKLQRATENNPAPSLAQSSASE